jgi:CBS domain containing-hemolysin-like protein
MITYPLVLLGHGQAKRTLGLFGVTINGSWTEAEQEAEGVDEASTQVGSRTELQRKRAAPMRSQEVPVERRQMIINALTTCERPYNEIMIPRADIVELILEQHAG